MFKKYSIKLRNSIGLLCGLFIIALSASFAPVFAIDKVQGYGAGTGVSTVPPSNITNGGIHIDGTDIPPTSQVKTLGSDYQGDIIWAYSQLYSDSWFKTSGSVIYVTTRFGTYDNQSDAINRIHPLLSSGNVTLELIDKNGNTVTRYLATDNLNHTASFPVKPNTAYYLCLLFDDGWYHSGAFTVSN